MPVRMSECRHLHGVVIDRSQPIWNFVAVLRIRRGVLKHEGQEQGNHKKHERTQGHHNLIVHNHHKGFSDSSLSPTSITTHPTDAERTCVGVIDMDCPRICTRDTNVHPHPQIERKRICHVCSLIITTIISQHRSSSDEYCTAVRKLDTTELTLCTHCTVVGNTYYELAHDGTNSIYS